MFIQKIADAPWFQRLTERRTMVIGFFTILLLAGIFIYRDFGISWDEPNMFYLGQEAFNYVFRGGPWTTAAGRMHHGPGFEILMHAVQEAMAVTDTRDLFLLRHLLNFLSFYAGVVFFYFLGTYHFKNWRLGLLGALMLTLSPRIFAHAFYNSRDIPALSLFIVCIYTLLLFADKKNYLWALIHAVACGYLVSVRITGIVFLIFTAAVFLYELLRGHESFKKLLSLGLTYVVLWVGFTVLFWPYLWEHPIEHFLEAYKFSSTIVTDSYYMAVHINQLPWHYVPVWIAISTPIFYTVFFLVGIGFTAVWACTDFRSYFAQRRNDMVFLMWFFLPIVALLLLHGGMYNEWRHLFFLYPAFLLISVQGISWTWRAVRSLDQKTFSRALQYVLCGWAALSLTLTGVWMVRNHPFEFAYFSIPSRFVDGNFELDYWGLSFRNAMEYVLAHDPSPVVPIYPTSSTGYSTPFILTPEQRQRVELRNEKNFSGAYIIDNYRLNEWQKIYPADKEIYSVSVDGIKIISVYRP